MFILGDHTAETGAGCRIAAKFTIFVGIRIIRTGIFRNLIIGGVAANAACRFNISGRYALIRVSITPILAADVFFQITKNFAVVIRTMKNVSGRRTFRRNH